MSRGKVVIPSDTEPWPHELRTAKILADHGFTVVFIRRSEADGVQSPDILMDGIAWEMKAPLSSGAKSLDRVLRRACKQSPHIVIDSSRMKRTTDAAAERDLQSVAQHVKGVKRLILVKRNREIVDIV